jgi:hypothetical protein
VAAVEALSFASNNLPFFRYGGVEGKHPVAKAAFISVSVALLAHSHQLYRPWLILPRSYFSKTYQ